MTLSKPEGSANISSVGADSSSRRERFLRKSPSEMFASVRWNLANQARHWNSRLRFDTITWWPKGLRPSFLAYYPDGLKTFPDLSDLYRRWIRGNKTNNNGDASRFMALMMNVRQVLQDGIEGDFAELGVWRGNSASILVDFAAKCGKRVFLFDTFAGFDERDFVGIDSKHKVSFRDTSIDYVRETVGHDDITTYVQGRFPDSITDEVSMRTFA